MQNNHSIILLVLKNIKNVSFQLCSHTILILDISKYVFCEYLQLYRNHIHISNILLF